MAEDKETASDIAEKVTTKEGDFGITIQRMDTDYEMWALKSPGNLEDGYNVTAKQVIPGLHDNDINIVSNEPRTYADQVQSTLSDAEMQIVVRMAELEGDDKRADVGKLERLLYFAFDMADRRLRKRLMPSLRDSSIWYSILRGGTGATVLVYKSKNGNVVFDITANDPRWLTYEVGGDDFLWTNYKTFRSGASLKSEWGEVPGVNYLEKENEILNYWRYDGERNFVNAVVCNKAFLKEPKKHEMRSFPVIIIPVSTRPPAVSPIDLEGGGYGDSIYASLRGINKIRNQFASIVATHANLLAKQPIINYYDDLGQQIQSTVYLAEAVLNLPKDHNQLESAPMKEISPTVISVLNWLNEQWEKASLPRIPIGTPAPSGTLYNLVQEAGNKVYNPQLKNLSYLYQEICRLIEEQLLDGKIEVDVKREEKRKYYETKVTPVDLKRPHLTLVEFTAKTPWSQLDTYQVADMAKRQGLPDSFIWEYILKLPDPKGIGDQSAIEMAEHSPKMAMVRAIQALMLTGRNDEAAQVMRDLYQLEISEQQGEQPPTGMEG